MRQKAFTLTELMIGLVISLLLTAAMATFLGQSSYTFQEHKAVMQDRAQLQKAVLAISRDLAFVGQSADDDGVFSNDGVPTRFLDITNSGDPLLGTTLTYYRPDQSMDSAASARSDIAAPNWSAVTFAINTDAVDPVTKDKLTLLERNGEPFLFGVTEFSIKFGIDDDDSGTIEENEWVSDVPADEDTMNTVIGGTRLLRLTLARTTQTADGQTHGHRLVRDIKLKNRVD